MVQLLFAADELMQCIGVSSLDPCFPCLGGGVHGLRPRKRVDPALKRHPLAPRDLGETSPPSVFAIDCNNLGVPTKEQFRERSRDPETEPLPLLRNARVLGRAPPRPTDHSHGPPKHERGLWAPTQCISFGAARGRLPPSQSLAGSMGSRRNMRRLWPTGARPEQRQGRVAHGRLVNRQR